MEGIVALGSRYRPRLRISTPVESDGLQEENLTKIFFLQTLWFQRRPNPGADGPRPAFLEDLELSRIVDRVIPNSEVHSVFELVYELNRQVENTPLSSPSRVLNRSRLVSNLNHDVVEYCWSEMMRLGRTRGIERERDWEETLAPAKSFTVDSDGDVIMVTAEQHPQEEYAEIGPDICECLPPFPCPKRHL